MAKLKAPLMSLGASGALGKALVFFGWKGLNVVREYVVPANPKTTAQNTQRGYLSAAVTWIHAIQGLAAPPSALDYAAWALLGSTYATPRTWFNTFVKDYIDRLVAGKAWCVLYGAGVDPGALKLTLRITQIQTTGAVVTDGDIYWGTSKTALVNILACTRAELVAGKDVPGLTAGVKYFLQYRANVPAIYAGSRTGIYYGVPTA